MSFLKKMGKELKKAVGDLGDSLDKGDVARWLIVKILSDYFSFSLTNPHGLPSVSRYH